MQAQQLQVAIFQGGVAGPYAENFAILREQAEAAKKKNADLIVVPEVFFTGDACAISRSSHW